MSAADTRDDISLEICVDDAQGLFAAQLDCVSRIELCGALDLGGLTPTPGLIALARQSQVPVFAMVRPRSGHFVFSSDEEAQMLGDIAAIREAGLAGVVLGAALSDSRLDMAMLARLSEACGPLRRQLHRVFDLVPDPFEALEQAIALGFERILTSGLTPRAPDGADMLRQLRERAAGRIDIMAGGFVRADKVTTLSKISGVKSFHASCRQKTAVQDERLLQFGFAADHAVTCPVEIVRLYQAACAAQHG
ncbi:copper homeostasis protein CutC [Asaia siamensis]|uniref:PF03932 family protein CutC n=1 Tax=Asaia siamensis TaxID=110479 RepID=A0ABQ1L9L7_9PROT|nr:copper homeostasis protein CutC [Asaia siamensis]GBR09290.1 copper homeostasis protein CutC [Asaia siamensis NRIC 0323]GGC20442.1 copper homeostasis protein CutC [Asaia siamensis]